MTILQPFFDHLKRVLKTNGNIVLKNPKSGTSTITAIDKNVVHYTRGSSPFSLEIAIIEKAYQNFNGKKCTTDDLAKFNKVFTDKNGNAHCGCTFFLMLMREFFGVPILGKGVKGNPFYVDLNLYYRSYPIKLFIRNLIFRTGKGFLSVIDFSSVKLAVDVAYLAMMPRTAKKTNSGKYRSNQ